MKFVIECDYGNAESFVLIVNDVVEIDSCLSKYILEKH